MNRCIRLADAVKAIEGLPNCQNECDKEQIISVLEELPEADSRERGKWVMVPFISEEAFYTCCVCLGFENKRSAYGPSCGAEMINNEG